MDEARPPRRRRREKGNGTPNRYRIRQSNVQNCVLTLFIICNEIDCINPSTTDRDVKLSISSHRTSKEDRLSSRQRRFLQRADPTLLFLFFPPLRGQRGEREKIPTGRKEGKKDTLSYSYSSFGDREKVAFFVRACMEVKEERNKSR